jgi:hypothetical protein
MTCLNSNKGGGGGWSEGVRPSLPKYIRFAGGVVSVIGGGAVRTGDSGD